MKRGQVTIFIILAVLIVAVVGLIYTFYPKIKSTFISELKNPNAFIEDCIEEDLQAATEMVMTQGGSFDPQNYFQYKGDKIEYLCYTNEYYRTCTMQQPMLKEHIEDQIGDSISAKADQCFDELKRSYETQGYKVTLTKRDSSVELLPKRIMMVFNNTLTLQKGDNVENYEDMKVYYENDLYEFVSIVISILSSETSFGDTEVTTYMNLYRDLKVEKLKQSDGTKIFILTDLTNDNKFQFATRGIAWPAGY